MNEEVIIVNAVFDRNRYFIFRSTGEEIEFSFINHKPRPKGFQRLTEKEKEYINKNMLPDHE